MLDQSLRGLKMAKTKNSHALQPKSCITLFDKSIQRGFAVNFVKGGEWVQMTAGKSHSVFGTCCRRKYWIQLSL